MKSSLPPDSSWQLFACLCLILALLALPLPSPRGDDPGAELVPLRQATSDAARSRDARFERRVASKVQPRAEAAQLWRQLKLEQFLTERFRARAVDFASVLEWRARPSSARGEPFGAAAVEASAPAVRIVGRGNVSGVWEGAAVPLELLGAPSRWLTPSVGRVHAELSDGTSFEGRLHSLGEGKLWIENELGRIALLGSQVRSLRQLPPVGETVIGADLPALPLVRVRTPGGIFQGRLLRREEGRVTLLSAEGGQVTLDDAELEPVRPGAEVRRP